MHALTRWWLVAAVVLLAISLKAFLVMSWVGGKVESAALAALQEHDLAAVEFVGIDGVDGLDGEGLNIVVEGPVEDRAAAVAALEARREVATVTYRPIASVGPADGRSVDESGGTDTSLGEPATAPAETVSQRAATAPMTVQLVAAGDGAVVLSGTVADERDRQALVAEAGAEYGPGNIADELVVDSATTNESGELLMAGEAASSDQRDEWLRRGRAVASAGGLGLVDQITIRPAEQQLNELFALEPIEFEPSRAVIRQGSARTLDAAAAILNENPGVGPFVVIGHTDSDGSADRNQRLSVARARAVINYLTDTGGVSAGRLSGEGRGESEPLTSPEASPEGKQRNRRIEWKLTP